MQTLLKASCLALYLLAIAASFAMPASGVTFVVQVAAILLLAGHVLELLVAYKSIRRYPGPLVDSMALTLLFGFLHWWPLREKQS